MTVGRGHGTVAHEAERCGCLRGPTTSVPQNGGMLLMRDVWNECPARAEAYGESAVGTPRCGLDVYDPTTGEIRSSSTDDIACWFIDSDYNEESFFVRHAYFTGADEPYKKLQRALKAEIDEAAWSTRYATVSRPFDPPSTGKIAVKVINHYGDEVLKVYSVSAHHAS